MLVDDAEELKSDRRRWTNKKVLEKIKDAIIDGYSRS